MPLPDSTGLRLLAGKGTVRLADVEQRIALGHWRPTPEVLDQIFRHTAGLLHALEAAVVMESTASS